MYNNLASLTNWNCEHLKIPVFWDLCYWHLRRLETSLISLWLPQISQCEAHAIWAIPRLPSTPNTPAVKNNWILWQLITLISRYLSKSLQLCKPYEFHLHHSIFLKDCQLMFRIRSKKKKKTDRFSQTAAPSSFSVLQSFRHLFLLNIHL
jgi:hypothetical protein